MILSKGEKNIVAIIIAIETYRNSDITTVRFAKNDALAFEQLLLNDFGVKKENITIWLNENAIKTTLEEDLPYSIRQLTQDDKFIFYYAGHGFHYGDSNKLTVWDTHKNNLAGTTVSLQDVLLGPLLKSKCQESLIFIDSCSTYLKEAIDSRDMISSMSLQEFEEFGNSTNFNALFCSCSPGEKSFSSGILNHGIWTWHLIEALKGKMPAAIFKDVFITDTSLQNFLRKYVPEYISKETTIRNTQTPFSKISSSNTNIIRRIPEPEAEDIKEFPKLKLKFEDMEMRRTRFQEVKKLSGFKKGHFVPDVISTTSNRYIQDISLNEIEEDVQTVYENCKGFLGLRRRDIIKEVGEGGGSIITDTFRYYIEIGQSDSNPAYAVVNRRLLIRVKRSELPDDFNEVFPHQPEEVVIPIIGKLDFDDLVEKFENLVEVNGGELKEDDKTGVITFTTQDGISISIDTDNKEMIVIPNAVLDCLSLIDMANASLKKIMGKNIRMLK